MIDLTGQPAELEMTIEIKRAATGETEVFTLIGRTIDEAITEDSEDGSNT